MVKKKEPPTGALKVDATLILKHKRQALAIRSKLDDVSMENARTWKAIDEAGISKKAFKRALAMNNQDPDEARHEYRLQGAYYEAMNPGVLGMQDLFAAVTPAHPEERTAADLLEIEAAGKTVGRKGERPMTDHQHEPGSEAAQAFERGWRAGNDVQFETREAAASTGTKVTAPRGRPKAGLKDDTEAARADLTETAKDRHDFEVVSPPAPKGVKPELKKNGPKQKPASKKSGPAKKAPAAKPKGAPKVKAKGIEPPAAEPLPPENEPDAPAGAVDVEPDPVPVDASAFDMSAHLPH